MKKDQNGISFDLTGCEKDADPLASEISSRDTVWNATKHGCSPLADDFINEIIDLSGADTRNEMLCRQNGHGKSESLLSSESNDAACELEHSGFVANFTKLNEDESKDLAVKENYDDSNCCTMILNTITSDTNCRNDAMDASEPEHSMFINETKNSFEPRSISLDLFKKDMDSYTDKGIVEWELPEDGSGNKESTYGIIKDICVDEGVPSRDKVLIGNVLGNQKVYLTAEPCDEKEQSDFVKENMDSSSLTVEQWRPSSKQNCDVDITKECLPENADGSKNNLPSLEDVVKDVGKECVAHISIQICEPKGALTDKSMNASSSEDCISSRKTSVHACDTEKSLTSFQEDTNPDTNEANGHFSQVSSVKSISKSGDMPSTTEELDKSKSINNLPHDNNLKNEKISIDLESFKSAAPGSCHDGHKVELHSLELQGVTGHVGAEACDNSALSDQVRYSEGETSFSATASLSGLISCSGPIAYSGNTSLRSDSSTTSTRSFAFPVLPSEWNSSPVRMAKADRRRYEKQRSWKQGLLCCRF